MGSVRHRQRLRRDPFDLPLIRLKDDFVLQRQIEQLELLILAECSVLPQAESLEHAIELIEEGTT